MDFTNAPQSCNKVFEQIHQSVCLEDVKSSGSNTFTSFNKLQETVSLYIPVEESRLYFYMQFDYKLTIINGAPMEKNEMNDIVSTYHNSIMMLFFEVEMTIDV